MTEASVHVRGGDIEAREFRARRIARLRERHWTVLAIAVCVVVLALSLEVTDGQQVAINGWEGLPLPQLCSSQLFFGASCPGCGLTRSFVHLAHGRIAESIATHRVGWILALVVVLQIPYRILAIRQSPVGGLDSRWPGWVSTALIVLLIGNWIAQLLKF
jgi:hypothetical protein